MRYVVDTTRHAVETLGHETIILDLFDGRLFLLEDGASHVWARLTNGESIDHLVAEVEVRYGKTCRCDVETLISALLSAGLLAESEECTAEADGMLWPDVLDKLHLSQFDDMTHIITMDPLHDVDPGVGWPVNRQP